jgi:O-antigen/teichoic acid export membrane protein
VIARNFLLTFSANAAQLGLAIVASVVAARLLAPEGRGTLAALILIPAVLIQIAALGTPQAITFYTSSDRERAYAVLGTAMCVAAVIALPVIGLVPWLVPWLLGDADEAVLADALWLAPALFTVLLLYGLLQNLFLGLRNYRIYNLHRVLPSFLYTTAVLFALSGLGAPEIVWLYTLMLALIALPLSLFHYWSVTERLPGCDLSLARRALPYSLMSWLAAMPGIVGQRLDQFMVMAFLSLRDLGYYAVAVSMAQLLYTMTTSIGAVLLPHLARTDISQTERIRLFSRAMRLTLLGVACICGAGVIALPWLIPAVFGEDYRSSVLASQLLLCSAGLSGLLWVIGDGFRGFGYTKSPLAAELFALLIKSAGFATILAAPSLATVSWVVLAGSAAGLGLGLYLFHRYIAPMGWSWHASLGNDLQAAVNGLRSLASGRSPH